MGTGPYTPVNPAESSSTVLRDTFSPLTAKEELLLITAVKKKTHSHPGTMCRAKPEPEASVILTCYYRNYSCTSPAMRTHLLAKKHTAWQNTREIWLL